MKKRSLKVLILTVLVSLLITFSFMGCSIGNLTKAPAQANEQSETSGSEQKSDQESAQLNESQQLNESDQDILSAFDNAVSNVAEKVKPSVVNIKVTVDQRDIFGNVQTGEGVGSGV